MAIEAGPRQHDEMKRLLSCSICHARFAPQSHIYSFSSCAHSICGNCCMKSYPSMVRGRCEVCQEESAHLNKNLILESIVSAYSDLKEGSASTPDGDDLSPIEILHDSAELTLVNRRSYKNDEQSSAALVEGTEVVEEHDISNFIVKDTLDSEETLCTSVQHVEDRRNTNLVHNMDFDHNLKGIVIRGCPVVDTNIDTYDVYSAPGEEQATRTPLKRRRCDGDAIMTQSVQFSSGSIATWGQEILRQGIGELRELVLGHESLAGYILDVDIGNTSVPPTQVDGVNAGLSAETSLGISDTHEQEKPFDIKITKEKNGCSGKPVVFVGSELSNQVSLAFEDSARKGWIERGGMHQGVHLSPARCVVLVVEAVDRRSGRVLCLRTLAYVKGLCSGCWILDARWFIDSVLANRLLFPSETYSEDDIIAALSNYEMGGSTVDSVLNAPRHARLQQRDEHGTSDLLLGYSFILLGENSDKGIKSEGCVDFGDVRWMIFMCGGTVVDAHNSQGSSRSQVDDENTCGDIVSHMSSESNAFFVAIDFSIKYRSSDLSIFSSKTIEVSYSKGVSRPNILTSLKPVATVTLAWLFDSICNQRVSREFNLYRPLL